MPSRTITAFSIVTALLAVAGPAQRVVLPGATGGVSPPAGWTVLRQGELDAATRATDPKDEPARARLLSLVTELQRAQLTDAQIVMHQQAPTASSLRLVQAYSAAVEASSAELLDDEAIDRVRDVLEPALAEGGAEVTFDGHARCDLWSVAGARLTFTVRRDGRELQHDHYLVPAGERLQYFDCTYARQDAGGRDACERVLATFDGAGEPEASGANLWLAGVAGAIAGLLTALARRKRQARALAAGGGGSATA